MAMTLHSVFPIASGLPNSSSGDDLNRVLLGSFNLGTSQEYNGSDLILVSWNIERGAQQTEIVKAFQGPLCADLYVLQEVDLFTRRAGFGNVAEEMARSLGLNYAFAPDFEELAQGRPGQPAFHGQAVLSRFPISKARILRFRHQLHNWGPWWKDSLPRWAWLQPRRGGRMALVTEIEMGEQALVIYNIHLESQTDDAGRGLQIQEILEDIEQNYGTDIPVIVAGDLNTPEGMDSPVLQGLTASGLQDALQNHDGSVQTKVGSNRREDWILMRNLDFSDGQVGRVNLSDHYPLTVCFAIPAATSFSSFAAQRGPDIHREREPACGCSRQGRDRAGGSGTFCRRPTPY